MNNILDQDRKYLLQIYDTQDVVFTNVDRMYLIDNKGKRYLDFSAQFSACGLGHGNVEMIDAIAQQMKKIVSVTSMFVTEERVKLAEKMISIAPKGLEKIMFGCTGSDANELALKIAKYYRGGGKNNFLSEGVSWFNGWLCGRNWKGRDNPRKFEHI